MATKRQTVKALAGSIEKWRAIVEKRGRDEGPANCPLCQLFLGDIGGIDCRDCPVGQAVDDIIVNCSPQYEKWEDHLDDKHFRAAREIHCPTCTRLAKAELKFLENLVE